MENFAKSLRLFKDYLLFAKNPAGANSCLKPYKTILSKLRLIKDLREIETLTCPNKDLLHRTIPQLLRCYFLPFEKEQHEIMTFAWSENQNTEGELF